MGHFDLKDRNGYHWEYVNPVTQATRIRVKDDWIDDSVGSNLIGLQLLAGAPKLGSRMFKDSSDLNRLYISDEPTSKDEALQKVFNQISKAVGERNAYHIYSSLSDYWSFSELEYSGINAVDAYPEGTTSTFITLLLSKDAGFRSRLPINGYELSEKLERALNQPAELWKFHILSVGDEVKSYSYYVGAGSAQEMNRYSPFWGLDSNTGTNYFYNSIELLTPVRYISEKSRDDAAVKWATEAITKQKTEGNPFSC